MRKAKREIKDIKIFHEILNTSDTCRLAFKNEPAPYLVPLSYGYTFEAERLTLYFHCAKEGQKLELMEKDPHVGFEIDCGQSIVTGDRACQYSTTFMSIVGWGLLENLTDAAEKKKVLNFIMDHYSKKDNWEFDDKILSHTSVLKLTVKAYTGKANRKEQS